MKTAIVLGVLLALVLAGHRHATANQTRQPLQVTATHTVTHPSPVHYAPAHRTVTRQAPVTTAKNTGHDAMCQPGWVCGTCPNGDTWGYLADSTAGPGGQDSTILFDDHNPCLH